MHYSMYGGVHKATRSSGKLDSALKGGGREGRFLKCSPICHSYHKTTTEGTCSHSNKRDCWNGNRECVNAALLFMGFGTIETVPSPIKSREALAHFQQLFHSVVLHHHTMWSHVPFSAGNNM